MELDDSWSVVDAAHEAFVAMDESGAITYWNPQAEVTFGWTREEALGRTVAETIVPGRYVEAHRWGLERFLATGEGPVLNQRLEIEARHRDGHEFPVEMTISVLETGHGRSFHAFLHDISERKRAEADRAQLLARLEAMARTDELTGVPNRRAWEEELRRELARSRRHESALCVLLLDLDCLKDYNDRHGHLAGDTLLREAATAWRMTLRVTDFIARFGGDEFAVVLADCNLDRAAEVAERLRSATPLGQTCSIGIAAWDGTESAETLLGRADAGLYTAKSSGRDQIATTR